MEHLLHRLYGVDALVKWNEHYVLIPFTNLYETNSFQHWHIVFRTYSRTAHTRQSRRCV